METQVAFVRHGETDWNNEQRAQGHRDIPLNEAGRQQALRVSQSLGKQTWDALYSSDLARARDTAEAIAAAVNLPLRIDSRWRERNLGQTAGLTAAERDAKFGPDWQSQELGYETDSLMLARMKAALEDLLPEHRGQRIIIVTHGGVMRLLHRHYLASAGTDNVPIPNTAVTLARYNPTTGWTSIYLGRHAHLCRT